MKSLRSILFVLAVILIVPAARAQQKGVKADVPFDFIVGNHAYPAGEYILKSANNDASTIRMENVQEVSAVFVPSNSCENGAASKETKLVFHRVAGRYFLYQVWTAGNLTGRQFPMSRAEVELARNHEQPDLVVLAAAISR
jgi:hypothetical protein